MVCVMTAFYFDDSHAPPSPPALVVEVQAGIGNPQGLFEELAESLRFPGYFGANWNALEDCIRDLSWLPPGPVILMHRDLPLAGDVVSQRTYLSILRDTVEKRGELPGGMRFRDLVVVFPPDTKEQVCWLLRSVNHDEAARQRTTT